MKSYVGQKTQDWPQLKGEDREVMRTGEYFRAALDQCCQDRGTAASLAAAIQAGDSCVSNLRRGIRTPDFKTATRIARALRYDLISFLEMGRKIVDGEAGNEQTPEDLKAAKNRLDAIWKSGSKQNKELARKMLEILSE